MYTYRNCNSNNNDQVESQTIYHRLILIYSLLLFCSTFVSALAHESLKNYFQPVNPIERFEPCEFENKSILSDILVIKEKIKDTKMIIEKIEYAMTHNLSKESTTTLLKIVNSHKVELQNLQHKFAYQQSHREKCYLQNYQIQQNKIILAKRIFDVIYFIIATILLVMILYNYKKSKKHNLSTELQQRHRFCCILLASVFLFYSLFHLKFLIYKDFLFPQEIGEEILKELPIFVNENYTCEGDCCKC